MTQKQNGPNPVKLFFGGVTILIVGLVGFIAYRDYPSTKKSEIVLVTEQNIQPSAVTKTTAYTPARYTPPRIILKDEMPTAVFKDQQTAQKHYVLREMLITGADLIQRCFTDMRNGGNTTSYFCSPGQATKFFELKNWRFDDSSVENDLLHYEMQISASRQDGNSISGRWKIVVIGTIDHKEQFCISSMTQIKD